MSSVATVIELLSRDRSIELVRAFEHGAGGTSLACLDGDRVVVKAWPTTPALDGILSTGLDNAAIMAGRSVPIPRLLERGTVDAYSYLLYEFVDGEWPAHVDAYLVSQLLTLIDRQRDAAPQPDPQWPTRLAKMIACGDPSLDVHPERLRNHPTGEQLLRRAQAALNACTLGHLRTTDIVHADFAPENILVRDGRITAVIDWEQSRTGDAGFDLAGMIYDIELGNKASPTVLAGLYQTITSDVPADTWRLYTSIYAVRYASWALNTEMESDVLTAIHRITAAR